MARYERFARCGLVLILLAAPGPPSAAEGVYAPVELKKREQALLEMSDEFAKQVVRRGLRYDEPEIVDMVREIGDRLAPEPEDAYVDYRFQVIRHPLPNAFALPDGQIYLHTGMLALLENEAQLSMLLAHEINHVAGHHSVVGFRSTRKKAIASIVVSAAAVAAAYGGHTEYLDLANVINQAVYMAMIGYSRDLEEEADRRAIDRVLDGEYDVRQAPSLFELMQEDHEGERLIFKWGTHPTLPARVAYLKEMVARIESEGIPEKLRTGDEGFRSRMRPLALETVHELVRADYPRTAAHLARRLVSEDEADARAHHALAEALRALDARTETIGPEERARVGNRKRAKRRVKLTREQREQRRLKDPAAAALIEQNLNAAIREYDRALELDEGLAEACRGRGYALDELGRYEEAGQELARYVRMHPEASDRKVVIERLRGISAAIRNGAD